MAAFAVVLGAAPMASAQQNAITGDTFTAGTTGALARLCAANAQEASYSGKLRGLVSRESAI
jgi:hypothetical protein